MKRSSIYFSDNSVYMGIIMLGVTGLSMASAQANIVLAREYCNKLDKHVKILKKFDVLNRQKQIIDFELHDYFILAGRNVEYTDQIVKICVEKMAQQKSLEPLLVTWGYAYELCIARENDSFVREFSILIFSVYQNLLIELYAKKGDIESKTTLEDIIQVYNAVSDLPIREIIITLEKCYNLFSKILNDYGAYSHMGWKQWLKKYWWLPPTVALALIGALLRKKLSRPTFRKKSQDNDNKKSGFSSFII